MDSKQFDTLARSLSHPGSRRGALGLLGGALALLGEAVPGLAKDHHHGKRHQHHPPGNPPGAGGCDASPNLCTTTADCCGNRVCAQNGCAIPDRPRCCSGVGQWCSGNSCECCGPDLDCVNKTCVYAPK